MAHQNELPTPIEINVDPDAAECLRVWAIDGGLKVIVNPSVFAEPGTWGLVLADLIHHVSDAYQKNDGRNPDRARLEILSMFAAEMKAPSNEHEGELVN